MRRSVVEFWRRAESKAALPLRTFYVSRARRLFRGDSPSGAAVNIVEVVLLSGLTAA